MAPAPAAPLAPLRGGSARPQVVSPWLLAAVLLLPLGYGLQALAARFPALTERWYARGLYPPVQAALGTLSSWLPFCVAEVLLVALGLALLAWPLLALLSWRRGAHGLRFLLARGTLRLAAAAGLLYAAFLLCWGLNYARAPYAESAGLDVRPASAAELAAVVAALVEEANQLRTLVQEDEAGTLRLAAGRAGTLRAVAPAFAAASAERAVLAGRDPVLRLPRLSWIMTTLGISGVYAPFTGEAQVNAEIPDALLPFVACHETAHQRGFAREDEANFIAYEACRSSREPDLRYTGTLSALLHALPALFRVDATRALQLELACSPGVQRDRAAIARFWQPRTETARIARQASAQVNHTYLQLQGESEGVHSYGRMVDLLVAERRAAR